MDERRLVVAVGALWIGMLVAWPVPTPVVVATIATAAVVLAAKAMGLWPVGLVWLVGLVVLLVCASGYAAWTWGQLAPVEASTWEGEATLVSDPVGVPGGVRVRLRIDGHQVDARAWGGAAGTLRARLMGEKVLVEGSVRPVDARASPWLATRHITGRMTVTQAGPWRTGGAVTRLANSVRRTIESGAAGMSRDERSLFTGLVYGDDRLQSAVTADDFQAAGLTHLLAVSGQNVAFILILAGPLLRRLRTMSRFGTVVMILFAFATLTRFEPSVLRASVMAGVAALAVVLGRPASSLRILALSIAALLLHDPLIAHAVAFQLSVAASLGILLISPRLASRCRGPRVAVEAVTVTAGAQLGVAPLLLWLFGGLPVASLPANVLAGPAAGPVMAWGVTGGLLAGLVPAPISELLHLPTRWLLAWISTVARLVPAVVPGELGALAIGAVVGGAVVFVVARRSRSRSVAAVCVGLLLLGATLHPRTITDVDHAIDGQSQLWFSPSGTVLALDTRTDTGDLLAALRTAQVDEVDLVVMRSGGNAAHAALSQIKSRFTIHSVWAPVDHGLSGAVEVVDDQLVAMGDRLLHVQAQSVDGKSRLVVVDQ